MKSGAIHILLADNQPLTAAGMMQFLAERDDILEVNHAQERDQFFTFLEKKPTLLVADYNMPGYITIEDLRQIERHSPDTHVLIISSDNNKASILEVVQLGVKGYLTKECSKEEVMMAIQSTARGEKFFCHKILDIIMEKSFSSEPASCDPAILTVRETEILQLIASGLSTQLIADKLCLSPHTVHTHRKSIIRKLNIKSPTEFVIYALDLGLIKAK